MAFYQLSAAPTAADVARHAAYIAEVADIAHAGIGTDICFSELGSADPRYIPTSP